MAGSPSGAVSTIPSHQLLYAHLLQNMKLPPPRGDFDFVRCANRKIRAIDGDAPFDGAGISQVYGSGSIYIRLNTLLLERGHVSVSIAWSDAQTFGILFYVCKKATLQC